MRLRRSDFAFPPGRQRRAWRDLRWALRLLTGESPSMYSPGSLLWNEDHNGATAVVYWCLRLVSRRGQYALQCRLPPALWEGLQAALAVWPVGHEDG